MHDIQYCADLYSLKVKYFANYLELLHNQDLSSTWWVSICHLLHTINVIIVSHTTIYVMLINLTSSLYVKHPIFPASSVSTYSQLTSSPPLHNNRGALRPSVIPLDIWEKCETNKSAQSTVILLPNLTHTSESLGKEYMIYAVITTFALSFINNGMSHGGTI